MNGQGKPDDASTGTGEEMSGEQGAASQMELDRLVVDALKTCYDPEIPVDIVELGLVYQVRIGPDGSVHIAMTLTSPGCPVAQSLPAEIREKILAIPGVTAADVEIVWDPPWTADRMSEAAKLELGLW
jgi:FeS assembly SUF system protein